MSWLWNSVVAYFCLNNNRGNWIIVIIHFPWLFPDFFYFPWLFPDHFSIPWLFQVFQKSGHPDDLNVPFLLATSEPFLLFFKLLLYKSTLKNRLRQLTQLLRRRDSHGRRHRAAGVLHRTTTWTSHCDNQRWKKSAEIEEWLGSGSSQLGCVRMADLGGLDTLHVK